MKLTKRIELFQKLNKEKFKTIEKDKILGQGWQGTVYKYCEKTHCFDVAVKKIYLDTKESKYIDDPLNSKALKFGNYKELMSAKLINKLLLNQISPNFIFHYKSVYIERSGICNEDFPYKSIHYNELIPRAITYAEWVEDIHSLKEWYNAYFQIVCGLYVLQKYFNLTHLDLHSGNILVEKVPKGGYWQYIIEDNIYNVPNLGYIFYINDFGQAYMPKNMKPPTKKIHNSVDLQMLFNSTFEYSTSNPEFKRHIKKIIKNLKTNSTFVDIIYEVWSNMYIYNSQVKGKPIEIYNTNKKI